MLIYEITAFVESHLVAEYEAYMAGKHIPDILATGYFTGASFCKTGEKNYRILYEAPGREKLDEYFEKAAPALRADFLENFPSGVILTREVWEVIEKWEH